MEEILASIKRVIAEDNRPVGPQRSARNRQPDSDADADADIDTDTDELADDEADDDVLELDDPLAEPDGLMSPDVAAVSRQSLAQLAAMREQREPETMPSVNEGALEALVRDMLRPLLKQWLEQRLPGMVEDLVSREIARITGKRL